MLNACLRCSTFFAGFFTLIQSLIWAGISIWGIAIYECNAPYPFQSTVNNSRQISGTYLLYVSYLRGACRDIFNYEAPSASRTYNILMAYSIISSIWVPTSVILLVGTCLGVRGNKAKWIYIPWIITTIANCVLDIYATTVYAIDISKTTTVEDYLEFLAMPPGIQIELGLGITSFLHGYTLIPAIDMTVASCRFVFLWLINFILLAFGLQGICAFSKRNKPPIPLPYAKTQGLEQNGTNQWKEFKRPEVNLENYQQRQNNIIDQRIPDNYEKHLYGKINKAYVPDEPLVLSPVEVEVKQEKAHHKEVRYAEVEAIELEITPEEVRRLEQDIAGAEMRGASLASESSGHISEAESVLPDEDEIVDGLVEESVKNTSSGNNTTEKSNKRASSPKRIYDAFGNPTDERLTPRVARIQRIIENQMAANQKGDSSGGYNAKPFSYTQPLKPQVDSVPKKNDTVRGLEKPPIPVPDYSVRVGKKPSFRTPLPQTERQLSTE